MVGKIEGKRIAKSSQSARREGFELQFPLLTSETSGRETETVDFLISKNVLSNLTTES